MTGGQVWRQEIQDALTNSRWYLVVLSPSSVESQNVQNEIEFALSEQKIVIPLLYRDSNVPLQLRRYQYVDFRTDYAQALRSLLRALSGQAPESAAKDSPRLSPTAPQSKPRVTQPYPERKSRLPKVEGVDEAAAPKPVAENIDPRSESAPGAHAAEYTEAVHTDRSGIAAVKATRAKTESAGDAAEADWPTQHVSDTPDPVASVSTPSPPLSSTPDEPSPKPKPNVETISSVTSDDPFSPPRDLLDIQGEAAAFARILAAKSIKPPLAIGIFGDWGSGKSFFMRSIYEEVHSLAETAKKLAEKRKKPNEDGKREGSAARPGESPPEPQQEDFESPFYSEIVQIRFNAWHYIETNLWASLVEYIFAELDRWLLENTQAAPSQADILFNRLSTAQQLKLDALEDVVARRLERQSAAVRADKARQEYERARAQSAEITGNTYVRAVLDTFLGAMKSDDDLRIRLNAMSEAVGLPELAESADRAVEVVEKARSEAGRAQLVARAGIAKLGTVRWIVSIVLVLIGFPILLVVLRDHLAYVTGSQAIQNVHDGVLALSGLVASLAACGGTLLHQAKAALKKIDDFDKALTNRVAEQERIVSQSSIANEKITAENTLKQKQQELEAAERALAEADTRLAAARQDFESSTARNRLNAFIRAKVANGDYAKHLGIIASIRRDFGQLATLMAAATDWTQKRGRLSADALESFQLAQETNSRVRRFLEWLTKDPEVQLTQGELRSLLMLIDPNQLGAFLDSQIAVPRVPGKAARSQMNSEKVPIPAPESGIESQKQPEGVVEHKSCRSILQDHVEPGTSVVGIIQDLQTAAQQLPTFSRIILYIDDLDRCPPKTVVNVLQAVHLLLGFPLFTVVVAVDSRWVSRALFKQYPNLLTETGIFSGSGSGTGKSSRGAATSHNYLEKIFQIPYWVRPMDDPKLARGYVNSLIEDDLRRGFHEEGIGARADAAKAHEASSPTALEAATAITTEHSVSVTDQTSKDSHAPDTGDTTDRGLDSQAEQHRRHAISLVLTPWECEALTYFAPLVAKTPRRLIRFVNVYRLVKTSLPPNVLDDFVGSQGESDDYLAMIAQLAIVTGACDASRPYFSALDGLKQTGGSIEDIKTKLASDSSFQGSDDHKIVTDILDSTNSRSPGMKVENMLRMAPFARRYSFTAGAN